MSQQDGVKLLDLVPHAKDFTLEVSVLDCLLVGVALEKLRLLLLVDPAFGSCQPVLLEGSFALRIFYHVR